MTEKQREFLNLYRKAADSIARKVLIERTKEDPELARFRGLPR